MKKVLSLVLVIAMVISSMSFAFAGTFEDVTDATTLKAVEALTALGVVNGYADGTFKPENSITRAEIAKLLVEALGHGDLAEGSSSSFKDAKGKWFEGYAAIAQSIGVTNGYPDGTFKGNNPISYQEAVVMILRALGYTDQTVNSNRENSYNAVSYKSVASRLGVLKNVTFKAGSADRGDVAKMLFNSLEIPMVVTGEKGNPVEVELANGQKELLLDKLAKRDTVTIGTSDLFGKHAADVSKYLGEQVVAFLNEDGQIVFVKESVDSNDGKVVSGKISATNTADNKFTVKKADGNTVTYALTGASVIVNGVASTKTISDLATIAGRTHSVKVVLNADSTVKTLVIEDVNNILQANSTYIAGKTKFQGINLPTKDGKVNTDRIAFVGDAESLEDIKLNDVVQACVGLNADGTVNNIRFYVTRDTIEGKVTEKANDNSFFIINGEKYSLNASTGLSLSLGAEGIFFLDKDNKIAYADTAAVIATNYGIITDYNPGTIGQSFGKWAVTTAPQVKMVGADGKEKIYDVVVNLNETDGTTGTANGFAVTVNQSTGKVSIALEAGLGDQIMKNATGTNEFLVKYALNEDGQITRVQDVTLGSYETAKKSDAKFLADNNTVVLARNDAGKYSLVALDKLTTETIGYQVITNSANFKWDLVVITTGVETVSAVKTYAVITDITSIQNSAGNTVQKITAYVDGEKVTYEAAEGVDLTAKINTLAALTFNTNGKVTGTASVNNIAASVTASAINADNTVIKVTNNGTVEYYTLSSDVVVYKANANGTVSVADLNDIRITNGTSVVTLLDKTADNVVDVIYIH